MFMVTISSGSSSEVHSGMTAGQSGLLVSYVYIVYFCFIPKRILVMTVVSAGLTQCGVLMLPDLRGQ